MPWQAVKGCLLPVVGSSENQVILVQMLTNLNQQLIIHLCAGLKWNRHIEWVCHGRSWEMCLWFHVLRFYCCFNLCSQFSFDFIAGMVGNVSADAWACSSGGAMVTKAPCATCWHWDVKCLIAARCISRSWCLMDKLFQDLYCGDINANANLKQ